MKQYYLQGESLRFEYIVTASTYMQVRETGGRNKDQFYYYISVTLAQGLTKFRKKLKLKVLFKFKDQPQLPNLNGSPAR